MRSTVAKRSPISATPAAEVDEMGDRLATVDMG